MALARALIKRPKLLLLDEPLAALDRRLREETQVELRRLQAKLGTTFVLVTHDQREAMVMASTIAVMRAGCIEQIGAPAALYGTPDSRWTATFMGDANILDGEMIRMDSAGCHVATPLGPLIVAPRGEQPTGSAVALALRPERVRLTRAAAGAAACVVEGVAFTGETILYDVRLADGAVLRALVTNDAAAPVLAIGDVVDVSVPPGAATLLLQ